MARVVMSLVPIGEGLLKQRNGQKVSGRDFLV